MNKVIKWFVDLVCRSNGNGNSKESDDSVTRKNLKTVTQDMLKKMPKLNSELENIVDRMDCGGGLK